MSLIRRTSANFGLFRPLHNPNPKSYHNPKINPKLTLTVKVTPTLTLTTVTVTQTLILNYNIKLYSRKRPLPRITVKKYASHTERRSCKPTANLNWSTDTAQITLVNGAITTKPYLQAPINELTYSREDIPRGCPGLHPRRSLPSSAQCLGSRATQSQGEGRRWSSRRASGC